MAENVTDSDVLDRLMTLWGQPWSEKAFGEAQVLLPRVRRAWVDIQSERDLAVAHDDWHARLLAAERRIRDLAINDNFAGPDADTVAVHNRAIEQALAQFIE